MSDSAARDNATEVAAVAAVIVVLVEVLQGVAAVSDRLLRGLGWRGWFLGLGYGMSAVTGAMLMGSALVLRPNVSTSISDIGRMRKTQRVSRRTAAFRVRMRWIVVATGSYVSVIGLASFVAQLTQPGGAGWLNTARAMQHLSCPVLSAAAVWVSFRMPVPLLTRAESRRDA
jgi:hypothetical protein